MLTSARFGRSRIVLKYEFSFGGLLPHWQQLLLKYPEALSSTWTYAGGPLPRSLSYRVSCVWRKQKDQKCESRGSRGQEVLQTCAKWVFYVFPSFKTPKRGCQAKRRAGVQEGLAGHN